MPRWKNLSPEAKFVIRSDIWAAIWIAMFEVGFLIYGYDLIGYTHIIDITKLIIQAAAVLAGFTGFIIGYVYSSERTEKATALSKGIEQIRFEPQPIVNKKTLEITETQESIASDDIYRIINQVVEHANLRIQNLWYIARNVYVFYVAIFLFSLLILIIPSESSTHSISFQH